MQNKNCDIHRAMTHGHCTKFDPLPKIGMTPTLFLCRTQKGENFFGVLLFHAEYALATRACRELSRRIGSGRCLGPDISADINVDLDLDVNVDVNVDVDVHVDVDGNVDLGCDADVHVDIDDVFRWGLGLLKKTTVFFFCTKTEMVAEVLRNSFSSFGRATGSK